MALSKKSPYVKTGHRVSGLMLANSTSIRYECIHTHTHTHLHTHTLEEMLEHQPLSVQGAVNRSHDAKAICVSAGLRVTYAKTCVFVLCVRVCVCVCMCVCVCVLMQTFV